MTVKELILHLKGFPPGAEVRMYSDEEGNRVNGIFKLDHAVLVSGAHCVVLIPKED